MGFDFPRDKTRKLQQRLDHDQPISPATARTVSLSSPAPELPAPANDALPRRLDRKRYLGFSCTFTAPRASFKQQIAKLVERRFGLVSFSLAHLEAGVPD